MWRIHGPGTHEGPAAREGPGTYDDLQQMVHGPATDGPGTHEGFVADGPAKGCPSRIGDVGLK